MKSTLIGIIVALTVALYYYQGRLTKAKDERDRYKGNQFALLEEMEQKEAQQSISVERMVLTTKELKEVNSKLVDSLEKQGIKIKRLESVSETELEVKVEIKEVFRDSIINNTDTIRCLKMSNEHIRIDICDTENANNLIELPVNIVQAIHRVPRQFWFIKWGTKGIKQDMFSDNEYAKIKYSRYIELK